MLMHMKQFHKGKFFSWRLMQRQMKKAKHRRCWADGPRGVFLFYCVAMNNKFTAGGISVFRALPNYSSCTRIGLSDNGFAIDDKARRR
jgi:hypothetical protein